MKLTCRVAIDIARPREEVFDYLVNAQTFPKILHKHRLITGIAGAEMVDNAQLSVGAQRLIHLTDGATIHETISEFERPVEHGYRWTGTLKAPLKWMVKGGHGYWMFSERSGGTHVDWSYTFEISSPIIWPIVKPITLMFRGWQRAGLQRGKAVLEG